MNIPNFKFTTKQTECQVRFEDITPTKAANYLQQNNNNPRKKINRNVVKSYAADMKAGKWNVNGEAIVFDANGDLKNGQHRLLAIIESGVTVRILVVRGVDPSITLFDYGSRRRVSQELNCNSNAEILARMIVSNAYRESVPPIGILHDYIIDHYDMIVKANNLSAVGANNPIGRKRDIYTAIYLMLRCGENASQIEDFMRIVNTQFSLEFRESTPAIVFYKYIAKDLKYFSTKAATLKNMETFMSAYSDFVNGNKRTRPYKITNTDRIQALLSAVRKEDGLEVD